MILMASMIELDSTEWAMVEDLFDPPGREGRPATYSLREMVDAILFIARTGCQWRYLPTCYPPWEAVWQQWRRLDTTLPALGTVRAVVADRGYRGLAKMANKKGIRLDIKAPPKGTVGFKPIAPLYRVEHAFARLGRWRRLSRCYEGSAESARAWLEVAALGYLFARLRVEPA